MQRICFVTGPWHLVTLVSSLASGPRSVGGEDDEHLVVFGKAGQEDLRASLLHVARSLRSWASVTDIGTTLDVPSAEHLHRVTRAMVERGLPSRADELWIPAFWPHTTKVAAEVWSGADIVLFEEGLLTYSLFERFRLAPWMRSRARAVLRGARGGGGLAALRETISRFGRDPRNLSWEPGATRSLLRRTTRDYRVLRSMFGTQPDFPRWVEAVDVPRGAVLETLAGFRRALDWRGPSVADSGRRVLFLPQNLSSGGWMDEDVEVSIYLEAIGRLVQAGYQVLWKEHPRAMPPLLPRILAAFPSGVVPVDVRPEMPVEAIAPDLGVEACCGIYTMSLAYLPFLHGIPSSCIAEECLPHVGRHAEILRGLSLVSSHVPSLDRWLAEEMGRVGDAGVSRAAAEVRA